MRTIIKSSICLILLGYASVCCGQRESLLIGPGDLLHIQVYDTPELGEDARVSDTGEVLLVLGGKVNIGSRTPAEAAHIIENVLREHHYLLDPHVTLTIAHYATQNVSVMGQVRSPGSYSIETPRGIVDVLSLAGGLNDLADRKITVERHGTNDKVTYFVSNNSSKALADSILVYPGDRVVVPKADLVYILGDVGRPGGYPIATNDSVLTVLQAIAMAGGTPPTAVPSRARLIRKQADGSHIEMKLPLNDIQKGKQSDMTLNADDIIYVPYSYLKNVAVGMGGLVASTSSAVIYRY